MRNVVVGLACTLGDYSRLRSSTEGPEHIVLVLKVRERSDIELEQVLLEIIELGDNFQGQEVIKF